MSTVKEMTGEKYPFGYKSPTDMGVSKVSEGIVNENVCIAGSIKEINRRMKVYKKEVKWGRLNDLVIPRMEKIIAKLDKYL